MRVVKRAVTWIGAMLALATFSLAWAEDVKLLRLPSIPESKILKKVQPAYPLDAVDRHIQGVVKITVLIGTNGHVENIQLVSGHRLLAPAALQAVRQWVFEPTAVQGHAVKVVAPVSIPFDLDAYGNPVKPPRATAPAE
jgi:TonB family protein